MSSDNILNQIRNQRQRPTVPKRVDALIPKPQEVATPETDADPEPAMPASNCATTSDSIEALKQELEQYPQTKRHSGIVLDQDLDLTLTQFCKERGITVETFLEAAWSLSQSDESWLSQIVTEAKRRYNQRKRVGQIKRLITMLSNQAK